MGNGLVIEMRVMVWVVVWGMVLVVVWVVVWGGVWVSGCVDRQYKLILVVVVIFL